MNGYVVFLFVCGCVGSTDLVLSKLLVNIGAVRHGPPKKCERVLCKLVKS